MATDNFHYQNCTCAEHYKTCEVCNEAYPTNCKCPSDRDFLNDFPVDPVVYEKVISDVLDTIAEMREAGDYDENTLETLEWRLSPPKNEEVK
jgi:hypothetical protein